MDQEQGKDEYLQFVRCSVHTQRRASAVCTNIDHLHAPLMCEQCASTHQHQVTTIDNFIEEVNQGRTDILDTLRQGQTTFEESKDNLVDSIESIRDEVSGFCNRWIEQIEQHYEECQEWLDAHILEHASSFINAEARRETLSEDISRNINFYNSRNALYDALRKAVSTLRIDEIDELSRVTYAAEQVSISSYCENARKEAFLQDCESAVQNLPTKQEVAIPQIPHIKKNNSSGIFWNSYQQTTPSQPYDFFTVSSRSIFANIDRHDNQQNAFAWSNTLKMDDVVVEGNTASYSKGTNFTFGPAKAIEKAIFMEARLAEIPQARWSVRIDSMKKGITLGFGEVTEKIDRHSYYCMDSTGTCHTNVPYTQMQGFGFSKGEVIEYRTRALENKLLVECRVDTDRISFQINNPSKELRFFVSFPTVGDAVTLLEIE